MPPKYKFTREEIVDAAVRVTRVKGIDAVTARDIADELGVSTQPVFTCFHTMEEAKREIRRAAEQLYRSYAQKGMEMPIPFYGFGMQYIRFAKEEPELYKLLFLTPPVDENSGAMGAMHQSQEMMRSCLQEIYHLDQAAADLYFRDVWLMTHGIATLIVTGGCTYTDQEISDMLTGISISICKAIKEVPGFVDGSFEKDAVFRKLIAE
ncbi:TetR/AcrR family transcriptional regulator [Ruminococcus sp.]|uniref:TetR/AcrR family transcriptional regulator n=1 Tax=Ruminococcus sp. TaxID=41978 RepID=UPI003F104192